MFACHDTTMLKYVMETIYVINAINDKCPIMTSASTCMAIFESGIIDYVKYLTKWVFPLSGTKDMVGFLFSYLLFTLRHP